MGITCTKFSTNIFQNKFTRNQIFLIDLNDYNAAGIIFTDERHILGGYQPHKKTPFISGIGGMKEPGETYMITAIRETLEELFNLENISSIILNELIEKLKDKPNMQSNKYISIICTFDDLQIICNLLKDHNIVSRLYDEIPNTLHDLIFKRKMIMKKYKEVFIEVVAWIFVFLFFTIIYNLIYKHL